jgi:hypothetical protein
VKPTLGRHVIGGGPLAVAAVLQEQRTKADCITLHDFKEQPPEECFLLVHHRDHWVPCWAPSFHGPYNSRPWLPKESYAGFALEFEEAATSHGSHLDITCRAAGDCLFHCAVIFNDLLAKMHVPRGRPAQPMKALPAPRQLPEQALVDLDCSDEELG